MIDPSSLVTLVAVERTGSVVAAAAELGYTPSAVSQQVKRLERQVGASLLDRVGRGVMLTELGRRLATEGRPIIDGLERLEAGLHGADPQAPVVGRVRLAAFSTGICGLVGPTLGGLVQTAPGLEVAVVELDPHEAIDLVARGAADAALVHNWGELALPFPEHLEVVALGRDVADVLVHRDHPMAVRRSVGAAELADDTWVCAPPGSVCHAWLTHMFDGPRQPAPDPALGHRVRHPDQAGGRGARRGARAQAGPRTPAGRGGRRAGDRPPTDPPRVDDLAALDGPEPGHPGAARGPGRDGWRAPPVATKGRPRRPSVLDKPER